MMTNYNPEGDYTDDADNAAAFDAQWKRRCSSAFLAEQWLIKHINEVQNIRYKDIDFALFHGIYPVNFTSYSKLLFSPGPGLGEPLSSYLEVVLYKFHR